MARIRTIKPSFFKNEELAELTLASRLLFIGLWTQGDSEGRLEDRPKRLKAEIFPYDSINIEELLSKLQSAGFIHRYEFGDLKLIQINNFLKHQRITGSESETKSDYPAPKMEGNTLETFGNTLETPRTTGREGKGKERKGKEVFLPPIFEDFSCYCTENGFSGIALRAYKFYSEANWHDSKGNPVLNWKQKLQSVWFKEENRTRAPKPKFVSQLTAEEKEW